MKLSIGQELPDYTVVAHNYADESSNKIHSDEVAGAYGFRGGLVPGVGVYAYMTVPAVAALGKDWLERGTMSGKFVKPVYDGNNFVDLAFSDRWVQKVQEANQCGSSHPGAQVPAAIEASIKNYVDITHSRWAADACTQ